MKIQIVSDLHLEFLRHFGFSSNLVEPAPGAELLVLAGDIHSGTQALEAFSGWPVPVVYVAGNHESYGFHWFGLVDYMRIRAKELGIHFLERQVLELPGVRVLGAALWTDYALYGNPRSSMQSAKNGMADHRRIYCSQEANFTPQDALAVHQASLTWLKAQLNAPFDGKTVVVSHHGVHPGSVSPQFINHSLTPAFVSDMRRLMPQVDVWAHGHVHSSVMLREGRCLVVANPRGYPLNARDAKDPSDLVFENPSFNPSLVVDV